MRVRSVHDLASFVKGRRIDLGINQAALAARAGVSRKWVGEFEAGKATAELGLVLRILEALGLGLEVALASDNHRDSSSIDLDAIIDEHRRR